MLPPTKRLLAPAIITGAALLIAGCWPPRGNLDSNTSRTAAPRTAVATVPAIAASELAELVPPVAADEENLTLYSWGYWKLPNRPLTAIREIAAGIGGLNVALLDDGSVVSWGQVGNGEGRTPAGNNFTAVTAGIIHVLALRTDGSVAAWGDNSSGQLNVPAETTFKGIAVGQNYSLGLRTDGSIAHWGRNSNGIAFVPDGTDFTAIASGLAHGLALKSDGSLVSWGITAYGLPTVPTGNDFVAIAANGYFSLALRADGTIAAWGLNDYGQVANAPTAAGFTAIAAGESHGLALRADGSIVQWGYRPADAGPPAGTGFKRIAAGREHSIAVAADDTPVAWGRNFYTEGGLPPLSGYTGAAVGLHHTVAVLADGTIVAWGDNSFGQATAPAGNTFTAVAAGAYHSVALRADGSVHAWGMNTNGEATAPPGNDFVAIAAGGGYSLALRQDGSIAAWGGGPAGLLTPPTDNDYVAIAAGPSHALALRESGAIVGWGDNGYGKATGRSDAIYSAIATGAQFSVALRIDGSIVAWGDSFTGITTPPTGFAHTAIAAGDNFAAALTPTGAVVVWGYNPNGTLDPPPEAGFNDLFAGYSQILALRPSDAPPPPARPRIAAPAPSILAAGDVEVAVVIDGDAAQVQEVKLHVDGTLAGTDAAAPYTFNVPALADGPHKFVAEAVLTGGVGSSYSSRTYTYRLDGPGTFDDFVDLLEFVAAQDAGNPLGGTVRPPGTAFTASARGRAIAAQVGTLDRALFAEFAVEVLGPLGTTPSGRYYDSLADQMITPLLAAVLADPTEAEPLLGRLIEWTPTVQALTNDAGGTVTITAGQAASLAEFATVAGAAASDDFALTLQAEAAALDPTTWTTLTADGLLDRVETQTRPPPDIVTPPAAQAATAGDAVTLTVGADGAGPYSYQWFKDGVAIPGATDATYSVPSAQSFHAGDYTAAVTNPFGTTTSSSAAFAVNAPPANNARLLNLSTRAQALTGSDILIPGFVISGTANKRLLIRAVGPTLGGAPYNVPGTLVNPRLALKRLDFSTPQPTYVDIAANDDWQTNANAAAITQTAADLFAFAFADAREAALLVDLAPGQYTVFADGVADATGIAIVELYDADAANVNARLINISNRGFVGTGAQVMIPGFVVSSEGPKTLLIRVVGPTLAPPPYNVPGTMADPRLQLFRKETNGTDTLLLEQDNWGDNPDAAFTASTAQAVSAFALANGSADAAFVVTLPPGVYTVVGSAADGTSTGVVLVEVYAVP